MKKQRGITLIALIITVILMLILAGVVISLTIGEKGLIQTAKYAVQKNSEETAREKLELALADLQAYKYTNEAYNENEYINNYLENESMQVVRDVVTVDGWRFKIDRSVPQIGESLGQEEIRVTKVVREYLGKNENGKYIAQVTAIIESDKEIKSIVFKDLDGIEVTPTGEKYKIAKDITIELDKEYKIVVNTTDGKSEEKTIIEKLPELGLLISTPYVGTSSLTTKVQYATNEEEVESYTYMLNEEEIATNANTEYTLEDTLDPETTYSVKVIAKYKNGLTVESNVVTIKTEKRTYLYNNGDECIDITGGWEEAISTYSGRGAKEDKYLYCYSPKHDSVYSLYFFKTKNKMSVEAYKKIGFKVNVTVHSNGRGGHNALFGAWDGKSYYYYSATMISEPKGLIKRISENFNQNVIVNISNLEEATYITGGISSGGGNDSISTNIYEVWLEK